MIFVEPLLLFSNNCAIKVHCRAYDFKFSPQAVYKTHIDNVDYLSNTSSVNESIRKQENAKN